MHNPYLIGKKVYLRPVEPEDAKLIQTWHNDPEIRKLAAGGHLPYTRSAEEEDIKNASESQDQVYLMIVKKTGDKAIGFIRLNGLTSFGRAVWLRMIMGDKNSWGQGYGGDALMCVLNWLFNELNVHRVELVILHIYFGLTPLPSCLCRRHGRQVGILFPLVVRSYMLGMLSEIRLGGLTKDLKTNRGIV